MSVIPEVHSCTTKEEMFRQCDEVHAAIVALIRDVPDNQLTVPAFPEGWTAAKNIKHIARSNRYFSYWIGAPLWLLKLAGRSKSSPSIEKARATNRPVHFDYGTYQDTESTPAEFKQQLIDDLLASAEIFKTAIEKRTEEELDTFKGLFGGFNLRTFALFTIKHAAHHAGVVKVRLRPVAAAL